MINLIGIEFMKFIKRRKFLIALGLLFIVFLSSTIFMVYYRTDILGPKMEINRVKRTIAGLEGQMKTENDKGASKETNNGYMKIIEDQKNILKSKERMLGENIPWEEKIKEDIASSKEMIKRIKDSPYAVEQENSNILLKEYYLKNNIPYDYSGKESLQFISAVPEVLHLFGLFGLFFIVGIMVMDLVSGENKPATIKCLLTKPIKRWKFIFAKFFVAVITINVIIVAMELLCLTVLGIKFGFGDPYMPVLSGTIYNSVPPSYISDVKAAVVPVIGSTILITKGLLAIKILIIQTLAITACISFCLLWSTIMQDSGASTAVALIFLTLMYWLIIYKNTHQNDMAPPSLIAKALPFLFPTYYDGQSVMSGLVNSVLGITFVSFDFAVLVLLGWITLCYGLSQIVFVKKDIIA